MNRLKIRPVIAIIGVWSLFSSCDYFPVIKKDQREAVARVKDTYLYKDELTHLNTEGMAPQDSALTVNNYVNLWVKHQLLLDKAKLNLEEKSDEFKILVEKYEGDLYINSYKEAVVQQNLNKEVSDEDLQKFYREERQNFRLNEELLQLKYIKFEKSIYNQKELVKLFKSKEVSDLDSLKSKVLFLNSHHLNDTVWVKFNDVMRQIPILKEFDKKSLLKKDKFIQKEDSLNVYLVTIKEVLERNEIAPISYVKPTMIQMILQQRKLLLIGEIEETLVDDARKKQEIEIY